VYNAAARPPSCLVKCTSNLAIVLLYTLPLFAQEKPSQAASRGSQAGEPQAGNGNLIANFGSFDGSWEGDLTFLQGATLSQKESTTARYRITIQDTDVHVYSLRSDGLKEIKPGKFHIEHVMTNAVLYAMDSGRDEEGTWVETWVFALTQKDADNLLANFSRLVNNVDLPLTNDHSKFAKEVTGELRRVAGNGYQTTQPKGGKATGTVDILSDAGGVDLSRYIQTVVRKVKGNWYNYIPAGARPPMMKKGKVAIEFAIERDGSVRGLKIEPDGSSGDASLDRAAWAGITTSNPFPPLPSEFTGQYLSLRFHFFYNPDKADFK
jgi:TonB family protein